VYSVAIHKNAFYTVGSASNASLRADTVKRASSAVLCHWS
jgi:hypothetical protein